MGKKAMETFSEKSVAEFLSTWEIHEKGSLMSQEKLLPINKRLQQFSAEQAKRFALTLEMIPKASPGGKALEIGSAPYLMSLLLRHIRGYDVTHTNLSHDSGFPTPISFINKETEKLSEFSWDEMNVEMDPLPYADKSFEVVLCCEVIEHLTMSPVYMLGEIHRVLKDDGLLILTTPNSLRLSNVRSLIIGHTVYDRYRRDSPYAAYGRHNREYTPGELQNLCSKLGFSVEYCRTADIYPRPTALMSRILDLWIAIPLYLIGLVSQRTDAKLPNKKDLIFIRAKKAGLFHQEFPEDIFYPLEVIDEPAH
jgi:2-polyprenyl-3-methyl-5-hydroxy-6-metoxy-1,4-benzoquinol methylase